MSLQSNLHEGNLSELEDKINKLKRHKLLTEKEINELCSKVNTTQIDSFF